MLYLKNSGIEIYNSDIADKVLYFLAAEYVELPVPGGCRVVMVYPYDWTEMMTPWTGSGRGMESTGGGKQFAEEFEAEVMKYAEPDFRASGCIRGIAGYSLGGLEALYMAVNMGCFDFAGSVSGSLWYAGAAEYFEQNPLDGRVRRVYLSLGSKEAKAKDEERRFVRANTDALAQRLEKSTELLYEINDGGHFTDIPGRIGKCAGYFASENTELLQ